MNGPLDTGLPLSGGPFRGPPDTGLFTHANNKTLQNFLKDILPDETNRNTLLQYVADITRGELSKQIAYLFGTGSNGKSTFVDLVLKTFGNNAILISKKIFTLVPLDGIYTIVGLLTTNYSPTTVIIFDISRVGDIDAICKILVDYPCNAIIMSNINPNDVEGYSECFVPIEFPISFVKNPVKVTDKQLQLIDLELLAGDFEKLMHDF